MIDNKRFLPFLPKFISNISLPNLEFPFLNCPLNVTGSFT